MTDLELLALQHASSLTGLYGITIACTAGAHALWVGSEVPDAIAAELSEAFAVSVAARDPAARPAVLDRCREILVREVDEHAGPSFVFPDAVPAFPGIRIERCDDPPHPALRHANPGNWMPAEWDELIAGQLGPWTMVLEGERAVSICHTPRALAPRHAECGVWTAPGCRGRGYAAATAAAWIPLVRTSERILFYSTDADNRSSQRVAMRLWLRPIGWTWRLHATDADAASVHPLSALSHR